MVTLDEAFQIALRSVGVTSGGHEWSDSTLDDNDGDDVAAADRIPVKYTPNPISPAYALCLRNIFKDCGDQGFKSSLNIVRSKQRKSGYVGKDIAKVARCGTTVTTQPSNAPPALVKVSARCDTARVRGISPDRKCCSTEEVHYSPESHASKPSLRKKRTGKSEDDSHKLISLKRRLVKAKTVLVNSLHYMRNQALQRGSDVTSLDRRLACFGGFGMHGYVQLQSGQIIGQSLTLSKLDGKRKRENASDLLENRLGIENPRKKDKRDAGKSRQLELSNTVKTQTWI